MGQSARGDGRSGSIVYVCVTGGSFVRSVPSSESDVRFGRIPRSGQESVTDR